MIFRGLQSSGEGKGNNKLEIIERDVTFVPDNEVTIKVNFSSLNFKDALCAKGHKGITRNYPHIPGIDASGLVIKDKSNNFKEGDEVVVSGYDLGMNTFGGLGNIISVPANWVHSIPSTISQKDAAILGTAGITSAISLYKMEALGLKKENGPVLVTGSTGGVGSIAIQLLSQAGYEVHASTGKPDKKEWLKSIGAMEVIPRLESKTKPLLPSIYTSAIDTVGGETLHQLFKMIHKEGSIAVCGNVLGNDFSTTIFPFLMRGVSLLGIDSAHIGRDLREMLWSKLSNDWQPQHLDLITKEIQLEQLPVEIENMLKGKSLGRILISHL